MRYLLLLTTLCALAAQAQLDPDATWEGARLFPSGFEPRYLCEVVEVPQWHSDTKAGINTVVAARLSVSFDPATGRYAAILFSLIEHAPRDGSPATRELRRARRHFAGGLQVRCKDGTLRLRIRAPLVAIFGADGHGMQIELDPQRGTGTLRYQHYRASRYLRAPADQLNGTLRILAAQPQPKAPQPPQPGLSGSLPGQ